ncbi:hypothetical protein C8J56DRAFT_886886 [Mycena floridula]|nr:hypothetical protein C8J56DRAFT_886886 [Mycena floridula]
MSPSSWNLDNGWPACGPLIIVSWWSPSWSEPESSWKTFGSVTIDDGDRHIISISWMQRYQKHSADLEQLSMHDLFRDYSWSKNQYTFEDYSRIKLLLHHLFRDPKQLLLSNKDDKPLSWTQAYLRCQIRPHHPRDSLHDWKEESHQHDEPDDDEDLAADIAQLEEADWMIYAHLFANSALPEYGITDLGNRPLDLGWDMDEAHRKWNDIDSMASYINNQKQLAGFEFDDKDLEPINSGTLSGEQKVIFDRYVHLFQSILDGDHPDEPMNLNIDGTADCGKTYLIHAIYPIWVIALSGVAALNTFGRTIHSSLAIPATNGLFVPLAGSRLATVQQS